MPLMFGKTRADRLDAHHSPSQAAVAKFSTYLEVSSIVSFFCRECPDSSLESRAQNEPTVQAAVRLPGRQSALHASLRLLHDKFQLAFACGSLDQTARSGVLPDMKAV